MEVIPGIEPEWIHKYGDVALTGKPVTFENYSKELDRYYEVRAYSPAKNKFAVVFTDITDKEKSKILLEKFNEPLKDKNEELKTLVMELLSGLIRKRGVDIVISPDLPVVYGDRQRLSEVMQNLIENGAKFMGEQKNPKITIGVRMSEGEKICFIKDNGLGIKPRYHEKVFGLFEQLDQKIDGTGIGLTLVKRIIETHGGRIWVESKGKNRGTSVCFSLPEKDV